MRVGAKAFIQYVSAKILLGAFGAVPRSIAYRAGDVVAWIGHGVARRQRESGMRNLRMALPDLSEDERRRIVRAVFRNLGRLLVEFSRFPELTKANIPQLVDYEGFDNYMEGHRRGKGILYLTAHIGAWELCSFAHSVYGYPLKFLVRPIDNPMIDELLTRFRTCSGNDVINRTDGARDVLKALRDNEAVGLLVDQNTTRNEGVFADFFGIPAATTPGLATFAVRTDAAVIPVYLRWDEGRRRHILHFDPPLDLIRTGDRRADIVENTKMFNKVLEGFVRQFPEQWLWIHRRWKTRPEGEPSLY